MLPVGAKERGTPRIRRCVGRCCAVSVATAAPSYPLCRCEWTRPAMPAVTLAGHSADADRATVLTTAKALKDAEDNRREQGENRWSPWQRTLAVAVLVVPVVALAAYIIIAGGA